MSDPVELDGDAYAHLRELAGRIHARHGFGHATLQPTVLLHEAWMKLEQASSTYESRAHFMATAARAMRQILVDRARYAGAAKRGGGRRRVTLTGLPDAPDQVLDALVVDRALDGLQAINARAAEVALMRAFGGMTNADIATVLDVTTRTVERDWRFATQYLADQIASER
ncbi:MAG: ECF-type sigma factor [Myxococcota bacterium]